MRGTSRGLFFASSCLSARVRRRLPFSRSARELIGIDEVGRWTIRFTYEQMDKIYAGWKKARLF